MSTDAIDLGILTEGKVHNLSGHERGLAARERFHLDQLDNDGTSHTIRVPDSLNAISPSFVQGFLAGTLRAYGNDLGRFRNAYKFEASDLIRRQIDRGIQNILMDRHAPFC